MNTGDNVDFHSYQAQQEAEDSPSWDARKTIITPPENLPSKEIYPDGTIEDPGRPEGEAGRHMLLRMNHSHEALRNWGLSLIAWQPGMQILDLGCGGGATIAQMLTLSSGSHIDGIDHMPASVQLARETNQPYLGRRVNIQLADVDQLPFPDNSFDLVTAVETTYFWQNCRQAFTEVYRVLRTEGVFAILNEACDPLLHKDWPDFDGELHIYTTRELVGFMKDAGFGSTRADHGPEDMVLIRGMKLESER